MVEPTVIDVFRSVVDRLILFDYDPETKVPLSLNINYR